MTALRTVLALLSRWLDLVAATLIGAIERVIARRTVRLVETKPGEFAVEHTQQLGAKTTTLAERDLVEEPSSALRSLVKKGNAVVVLHPSRFLFKPFELPSRAADFLEGIVRSQIDRLTPWSPAEAVFGWTAPVSAGADRIAVTVAATARARLAPYVRTLTQAGAARIAVHAGAPDSASATVSIPVLEQRVGGLVDVAQARRALLIGLIVAGLAAVAALGAATAAAVALGEGRDELIRQVSARRAALRAQRGPTTDPGVLALRALERRKHETLPSVLVLEVIARVLPDHTHVTEFRIENDMVRISGFTRDAPALIQLIEQASEFSRATFFAPTTRAPSDPGERYHIEARVEPRPGPPS